MTSPHFITRELDRRITLAKDAHSKGNLAALDANAALKPWAAAEAWIVGHQGQQALSPRDGYSRADDLCSLADTIAELTRARDNLARIVEAQGGLERAQRWIGLRAAVRDLERLRDLRTAFRQQRQTTAVAPAQRPAAKPALPPSLLADMFGADGQPLPIQRNAA
jgi:hypothetical protein